MKRLMMLAVLALCSSASASETQRLTFSGEVGGLVRHVRVLGTLETYLPQGNVWLTQTYGQNEILVGNQAAQSMADSLEAWLSNGTPFQLQIQRSMPNASYSLLLEAPYQGIYLRVILQAGTQYVDSHFGTMISADGITQQSMLLTTTEAQALTDGLVMWTTADHPPGGVIFSKMLQQP